MTTKTIDYSRYRVAEAIVEQWRAGDTATSIADNYDLTCGGEDIRKNGWLVELIVAAYDRRGTHYPKDNPK